MPLPIFETPEQEVARLASAPEGSTYHSLSKLEVNILGDLTGAIIDLPRHGIAMVVVPLVSTGSPASRTEDGKIRRFSNTWDCVVVASENPKYKVGGYHLSISEAELRRGTERPLVMQ
jgi:hypothetical protein